MNNWYHNTEPDAAQGLVIEENTGRTIAVAYDPKDTALLAAAPAMLAALEDLVHLTESTDIWIPKSWLDDARRAVAAANTKTP